MKASDCKCVECGEQAVAFWPVFDPDIPANPYCRKCLDKAKMDLIFMIDNMLQNETKEKENIKTKKKKK